MPRALSNQAKMLQGRSRAARASDDQHSEAGTMGSWRVAEDPEQDVPPDHAEAWSGVFEPARAAQAEQPQPSQPAQAAPVTQAARSFVDRSNETPAARRLRAAGQGSQVRPPFGEVQPDGRSQCHQRSFA